MAKYFSKMPPTPPASEAKSCWDKLCAVDPTNDAAPFGEWTKTDLFFGNYVDVLEDTAMPEIGGLSEVESTTRPGQRQPSKLPRWKTRNPKQHEDNKRFQREYRARKKARQKEMEARLDNYNSRLDNLSNLKAANSEIEKQNAALKEQLQARETQLLDIREELDGKTSEASFQNSRPKESFIARAFSSGRTREQELAAITQSFITQMEELQTFLEARKVQPNASASALDHNSAAELDQRCERVMQACMGVLNLDGPNLDRLAHTLSEKMDRSSPVHEKYAAIVAKLQLSEGQTQQTLTFLEKVTQCLERIYLDRQGLNLRVMALIGPSMAPPDGSLTKPLSNGQPTDFAGELRAALLALQESLREEQRLESEQHYTIFKQILTPAQGGWLIAMASPDHCDLLAFAAAVKSMQGVKQ